MNTKAIPIHVKTSWTNVQDNKLLLVFGGVHQHNNTYLNLTNRP